MARRLPFPPCTLKPSASPAMPRHTPQAARRAPDRSRARTACSVRDDVRNAAAQMHHRRLRPQRDVCSDAAQRAWRVVRRVTLICIMQQHAQACPALLKHAHVAHTVINFASSKASLYDMCVLAGTHSGLSST